MQTGYQGRVPVVEWLKADETLRGAIRRQELQAIKAEPSLEQQAKELLHRGITDEEEYKRVFGI